MAMAMAVSIFLPTTSKACFKPSIRCSQGKMGEIVPAVIVGAGRIGQALAQMGDGKDVIVKRGEPIPSNSQGPIFVCTRNDDLNGVVDATPPARRDDLVFFQNGMLEPWLLSRDLAAATQVLVYFAVAKLGQAPLDGRTDLNPEGLTAASGKWAPSIADRLHSAGLSCKVLDEKEFVKPLLEKLIWISAFMLVGARHGVSVGEVEHKYKTEVRQMQRRNCIQDFPPHVSLVCDLISELAAAASKEKNVIFDAGVEDRLCAYARSVAHFPTAVKEFEWRNGWFYSISQKEVELGKDDPCPLHSAWLKEVGAI